MTVDVRPPGPDDAEPIADLLAQLGYPPSSAAAIPPRLERLGAEGQVALVAVDGGRVVGLATMFVRHVVVDDAPFARLAALVVDERVRGRGIGRMLLAAMEEQARVAGCATMEVTSGDHRPDAHRFYRSVGFEERPRRFLKRLAGSGQPISSSRKISSTTSDGVRSSTSTTTSATPR